MKAIIFLILLAPPLSTQRNNFDGPLINAKCDGVTDNHDVIQSALNANQPVLIPAGICLTSTLTWIGQNISGVGKGRTILRGLPGKDVLATPDSAKNLLYGAHISDMTIQVDGTVNAASSTVGGNNTFPNRIFGTGGGTTPLKQPPAPGSLVFDPAIPGDCGGTIFAGSKIVTVPCSLFDQLPPADYVGMAVTIEGAGPNGGPLETNAVKMIDGKRIQLANAAFKTATAVVTTIANPFPPPWHCGNAAIAIPATNGAAATTTMNGWVFENLMIQQINRNVGNYVCGIFIQVPPNNIRFENIDVESTWGGIIEALPSINASRLFAWTPDTNIYTNMNIKFTILPLVWVNGAHRTVVGLNIYGGNVPYSRGIFQFCVDLGGGCYPTASFIQYYNECWTPNTGELARFTGIDVFVGGNLGQCNGNSYVNLQLTQSTIDAQIGVKLKNPNLDNYSPHLKGLLPPMR